MPRWNRKSIGRHQPLAFSDPLAGVELKQLDRCPACGGYPNILRSCKSEMLGPGLPVIVLSLRVCRVV